MLIQSIALVSLTTKTSPEELSALAAALQKQVTRDLSPIWDISATVDFFPGLNSIPVGYWPIVIMDDINQPGAAGYHTDKNHQPFSYVQYDDTWQLTCSHELCEMLVDPYGNRLIAANSIEAGQGRVQYLVEVCDPCEDASFAYSINGIPVSDFYTPHYFDPVTAPGVRYSFTGSIQKPLEIKKNGYLSWYDPETSQWFQANYFGLQIQFVPLNGMKQLDGSLRSQVDKLTKNPNGLTAFTAAHAPKAGYLKKIQNSSVFAGKHWQQELDSL